jgi:hypothetical protein
MPVFNDANVPFGSQIVTIGSSPYVADGFTFSYPSAVAERFTETGAPGGQVIVDNFATGSGTLQLATTISAVPTVGATFTLTVQGATIGVVISEIGYTEANRDIKKVSINIRKRYNS